MSLLFGHIANYQSRGAFSAPEQLGYLGDGSTTDSFRALMNPGISETDVDLVVPSTTLVAFMVRWMLVFEERDADVIWLLKMAPRRFFPPAAAARARAATTNATLLHMRGHAGTNPSAPAPAPGSGGDFIHVGAAPTRFGSVTFSVNSVHGPGHAPPAAHDAGADQRVESGPGGDRPAAVALHLQVQVVLNLTGHGIVGGGGLAIKIRLRDPTGSSRKVRTASIIASSSTYIALGAVNSALETVQVNIAKHAVLAAANKQSAGEPRSSQATFTIVAVLEE